MKEDLSNIPGPKGIPFLGSVLSINPAKMHLSFCEWALKYGRIFKVKIFGNTVVVLNDFDLVRKVFADKEQIEVFNDRPEMFVGKFALYETSDVILYLDNNKKFMMLKRILQKCLKRQSQTYSFRLSFEKELERLKDHLNHLDGKEIEINPLIRHSLANVISILMSGEGLTNEESKRIWEFNDNVLYLLETSVNLILSTFPFMRFLPGRLGTVFSEMMSSRDWVIDKYFEQCKLNCKLNSEKGLVYALLAEQENINNEQGVEVITDENIKGIILDLVVAAMKTTNSAVAACFLLLLKHPKHVATIQNEIDEIVGQDRVPDEEDQSNMPFCRAFIYEVLRYISHGTLGLPHLATTDYKLEGYTFSKNDIILSNIWFIHHDPEFWDKPWEFHPQRFLDETGNLVPADHDNMRRIATFSVGRRVCIGKDIALTRIFLYMTSILQQFSPLPSEKSCLPDADPHQYNPGLVLEPNYFSCRLIKRK
ncbi:cytochrome P450 2C31-like [Ruditapes philippinarum]|uniref:cytochrome P450 2C31-like n=1 Tax=Ruditapes philippinarum TaxID=129788 RepID=UPI00295AF0C1|nr:cytochrome P450 2C31-like [Ruditapes philippinarum]